MGLDNCDRLAAGKKADLIMIDLQQPNMQPENNIVKKSCIQRKQAKCQVDHGQWKNPV